MDQLPSRNNKHHIHNKMMQAMDDAKNDYVVEEHTITENESNEFNLGN